MMSLIDHFRAFHTRSKELELSACARSVFYTLLGEFNERHWPEELSFSDGALKDLSGVKSLKTIHDVRNLLKEYGLIDFRSGKNRKAVYRLPKCEQKQSPTTQLTTQPTTQLTAQPTTQPTTQSDEIPNNACAIDVKTLRQNQSIDCACEKVEELDELLDYWERDLHGGRLSFEHQSKLSALMTERGLDWLKAAMTEAADANNNPRGLSPKFLFSVIARKQGKPVKPKQSRAEWVNNMLADLAKQKSLTGQRSD